MSIPIVAVTVLEDRAVVKRSTTLSAGQTTVIVSRITPLLQNLSVQAEVEVGEVVDVRVKRVLTPLDDEKPKKIQQLLQQMRSLKTKIEQLAQRTHQAVDRQSRVWAILVEGFSELPEDAVWELSSRSDWESNFAALFERVQALDERSLSLTFEQEELYKRFQQLQLQLSAVSQLVDTLHSVVEIDLFEAKGTLTLTYVVGNAMWRPIHEARWSGTSVRFTSSACVWQNTGEDWENIELSVSTARASLGNEPPLLSDDLLTAQKKAEEVVLAAREVLVDEAMVDGVETNLATTVSLPGVDDGGEIRTLTAGHLVSVVSNGLANVVQLSTSVCDVQMQRVCSPELNTSVLFRVFGTYTGSEPLLAGPVELFTSQGAVGWTNTKYIAPGGAFELSFGPDDQLSVLRETQVLRDVVDPVDKRLRRQFHIKLHISNMGKEPRVVRFTERVVVSEVEQVAVKLLHVPELISEEFGLLVSDQELQGRSVCTLQYVWELSSSPGVALPG